MKFEEILKVSSCIDESIGLFSPIRTLGSVHFHDCGFCLEGCDFLKCDFLKCDFSKVLKSELDMISQHLIH